MERVIIIEDDAAMRRLMAQWVTDLGFEVSEAARADEAVAAVAAEDAAVALVDIRLPGRDGLWLAGKLHREHPATAIIMTTGVQDFRAAVASLRSGVLDYLVKPFDAERLHEAVRRGVEWHRARVTDAKLRADLRARAEQVSMALAEVEVNSAAAVDAMRNLVAIREGDAYEHGRRVAKTAVDLALALGVKEPAVSEIERAALLHDLGKIAVSEALLQKPNALTPHERQTVRGLPERGHDVLRDVPFLSAAAELVLTSHERFDGTGHPAGLHGHQIPLGARVLAVADAYAAMTAPRAYRKSLSHAEAVAELVQQRGKQFDPQVVDAFLKLTVASVG